jgi:hypothetical protein
MTRPQKRMLDSDFRWDTGFNIATFVAVFVGTAPQLLVFAPYLVEVRVM